VAGRGKGLAEYRETLRLRATDLVVKREVGLTPLSVAADKIAITTFRCALLLDRLDHELGWAVDRSGTSGRVAEVYPAAALRQFGLTSETSYKAADAFEERTKLARGLARALGIRRLPAAVERQCRASDHALDALVSAIVARAVALNWTRPPRSSGERALAQVEGWIHFPHTQAAQDLAAGSPGPQDQDAWPTAPAERRAVRTSR